MLLLQIVAPLALALDKDGVNAALATFYQTLGTSDTATFTTEFEQNGQRIFAITDMTCTLDKQTSKAECEGGTVQLGPLDTDPKLDIQKTELQYADNAFSGVVKLKSGNAWTKYGFELTNIEGEIAFDKSGVAKIFVGAAASLSHAPKYELKDGTLRIEYERENVEKMLYLKMAMTLLIGQQGQESKDFPALDMTAEASLGGGEPLLLLEGAAEKPWRPLGEDGASVEELRATATLTDAGLVGVTVGPFSFEYANFALTLPSSINVDKCSLPTCSQKEKNWWSPWGRRTRKLLFASAPQSMGSDAKGIRVQTVSASASQSSAQSKYEFEVMGYTCTLDLANSCEMNTITSNIPVSAQGTLNLDVTNAKAWGSLNLEVKGDVKGFGDDIPVDFKKNVFPYTEADPLDVSNMLTNAELNLCGLVPNLGDLKVKTPAFTISSQNLVPEDGIKIKVLPSLGIDFTIERDNVPSFNLPVPSATVKLGSVLSGVTACKL